MYDAHELRRCHFLPCNYMPLGTLRCAARRLLARGVATTSSCKRVETSHAPSVQQLLSAYPIFNLNDEYGRHLGPRRGDEAVLTLSGGVDSSVAAFLGVQEGGLVPCKTIFMRNWNSLEESDAFEPGSGGAVGCQWKRDWERVSAMAKWLGVEAELMDLSIPYWNTVFSPSLDEWSRGQTPNPDILCNREIKFGELLRRLDGQHDLGSFSSTPTFGRRQTRRWLVTGHYAGLQYYHPSPQSSNLHGRLYRASDRTKDQSYFLSAVSSEQLGRTHFPLSKLSKVQARQMARTLGMPTSESEESMGLCFVGERNSPSSRKESQNRATMVSGFGGFANFLSKYIESSLGDIVDQGGRVLGKHNGLHTLTIGQGAKVSGAKEKLFVAGKDARTNRVLVVPGSDHPWLQCHSLQMSSFAFINRDGSNALHPNQLSAQIRHRQAAVPCRAQVVAGDTVSVLFDPPVLSVAEGQNCALYRGDECLGSGVITSVQTQASLLMQGSPL